MPLMMLNRFSQLNIDCFSSLNRKVLRLRLCMYS
uniref:Uncharacterized protein n=1 Tax=Arundo donax TaxID=35708 RepID=A0A0A8YGZ6_ARUDO